MTYNDWYEIPESSMPRGNPAFADTWVIGATGGARRVIPQGIDAFRSLGDVTTSGPNSGIVSLALSAGFVVGALMLAKYCQNDTGCCTANPRTSTKPRNLSRTSKKMLKRLPVARQKELWHERDRAFWEYREKHRPKTPDEIAREEDNAYRHQSSIYR